MAAETCRDVINRALRKLGVLRSGGEAKAADAADALASLSSYYMESVTSGTLGRVYNSVLSADTTVTAEGGSHYNITTENTPPIDLPTTVPWGYWWTWMPCRDYGWGLHVPFGTDTSATVPQDRAVVMITDKYNETRATYLYDGTVQRWMRVDDLSLTDEAPLSARDADGLAALLAMRIADQFGDSLLSALTIRAANRYKMAMVMNYGNGTCAEGCW